jgi:alkyl sulfatase BDS1-like metallo-beta-lactamase superfamily hydrolase
VIPTEIQECLVPKYKIGDHPMIRSVGWRPEEPAERANDHILFSRGTTNSNLVCTSAGDVIINTGLLFQGERHKERYEALLGRPLDVKKIVLTQYHSDHVGGWQVFAGPGVETLAQVEQRRLRQEWRTLTSYYQPRGARFLAAMMPKPEHVKLYFQPGQEPEGATYFSDTHAFQLGDIRFELFSLPSGETLDSVAVWLPREKTLFSGNFMGALYGALPNFYTIRGDRDRSVPMFLRDIQRLIDLEPELLITGHDEPISGKERIHADLCKIRDAVRFIHDETVKGMNAHKDVHTLMQEIRLPEHLAPRPGRGPVQWYVRAVWEEYSGWFMHQSTTELYGVPQRAVWADIAGLAGGPDKLAELAQRYLAEKRPLEAIHLTDIATAVESHHGAARKAQIAALEMLIDQSAGTSFDEIGWLENETRIAKQAMEGPQ